MSRIDGKLICSSLAGCLFAFVGLSLRAEAAEVCSQAAAVRLTVDQGHPWRPPFGLERVGAALVAHVELAAKEAPRADYSVTAYRDGGEFERHPLKWQRDPGTYGWGAAAEKAQWFAHVRLRAVPTEVSVQVRCENRSTELARHTVAWPAFEADAVARPERPVNPVDLGAVLVPKDWLLLANGERAVIEAAALSRGRDLPQAKLRAWFAGGKPMEVAFPLKRDRRAVKTLRLPLSVEGDRTTLHVSLTDGQRELWRKEIRAMVVEKPPRWPAFGAIETQLRYDSPVPVTDPKTGARSTIDYERAWDPSLNDVVVLLPNGSRFVFWRGASYCPFWAGPSNTGVNYQWAEHQQPGFVDTAEPLMDKELRHQRVRIMESTASRIHVRWNYESVDFNYQRWGDQAQEDFYFYPDGFGTRVVTLTSGPDADYELLEFILLTPQSAFPLEVLPEHLVNVLSLEGAKQSLRFPLMPDPKARYGWPQGPVITSERPLIYRIFAAKDDPATAIAFNPGDLTRPPRGFPGMYEQAEAVTPAYWGSHWPLTRGQKTTRSINDGIHQGPAHSTLLHWGLGHLRPTPIWSSDVVGIDTLGRSRPLRTQRWVWMIAKTDASDEFLRAWAHSFADPPSIKVSGARLDVPSYSPERRALRLIVESSAIEINLQPASHTVNPVFELDGAPKDIARVTLNGEPVPQGDYAWDGATLWLKANVDSHGAKIGVAFQ